MAEQSKLEQVAIQQRNTLIPFNYYNGAATGNGYSATHTRAKSDQTTPIPGKGTGTYMDTQNGGGSLDINGSPLAIGSGRVGNITFNNYNQNDGYTTPDTSGNVGQVHW